jgi:hypothetical protein
MRHFTMTVMALTAFGAMVATTQARSQSLRPSRAVSAAQSTCTGLKSACLSGEDCYISGGGTYSYSRPYCQKLCDFKWEQCLKTGWWEGGHLHRSAERR